MNIVGPLPTIDGQSYVLALIDRYTRWPEAVPMPNITAETTSKHFIETRIARFGVPTCITTDHGKQFTSDLFNVLNSRLRIEHLQTSPYHPQSNEIVERLHRTLKTSIRCHQDNDWVSALPTILLAHRSQAKADLGASQAQLVCGTTLRIPGEFFQENTEFSPHTFGNNLTEDIKTGYHRQNEENLYKTTENYPLGRGLNSIANSNYTTSSDNDAPEAKSILSIVPSARLGGG